MVEEIGTAKKGFKLDCVEEFIVAFREIGVERDRVVG